MLIPILHTLFWICLALNTQLIEGTLCRIHDTPDSIKDKIIRWMANPSALKGWLGVCGLIGEMALLWLSYFKYV